MHSRGAVRTIIAKNYLAHPRALRETVARLHPDLEGYVYNVAYWNLAQRKVEISAGTFPVNGSPLRFFRFSGFDAQHPDCLSKYQNLIDILEETTLQALLRCYVKQLDLDSHKECRQWPYAYVDNGVSIPDLGRSIHLDHSKSISSIPFSDEGYRACIFLWNDEAGHRGVSQEMFPAYGPSRTRDHAESAMPDIFRGNCGTFFRWLLSGVARDRDLPYNFLADAAQGRPDQQFAADSTAQAQVAMTRLAWQVYEKREYIQTAFPDPDGKDAVKFLASMLSYRKRQCELRPACVDLMHREWESVIDRLPNSEARYGYWTVLWARRLDAAVPFAAGAPFQSGDLARIGEQGSGDALEGRTPKFGAYTNQQRRLA